MSLLLLFNGQDVGAPPGPTNEVPPAAITNVFQLTTNLNNVFELTTDNVDPGDTPLKGTFGGGTG